MNFVRTIGMLAALCVATVGIQAAEERVAGAAVISESEEFESVLMEVVKLPLTQKEVDLLIANKAEILAWADENAEQWLSADDAENPWRVIQNFPVWRDVEISAAEFMAVASKVMFVSEYAGQADPVSLESMKAEKQQMLAFLESSELPDQAKPQVEAMLKQVDEMIDVVENVLPKSQPVFLKNKETLNDFLSRMEGVGE
ncbi:hypothetical protein MLD52_21160 [Puniceicoccaceae bacterium K14]|nr:hypothetical protein [Puniceicoccaceae bacterium K14]